MTGSRRSGDPDGLGGQGQPGPAAPAQGELQAGRSRRPTSAPLLCPVDSDKTRPMEGTVSQKRYSELFDTNRLLFVTYSAVLQR